MRAATLVLTVLGCVAMAAAFTNDGTDTGSAPSSGSQQLTLAPEAPAPNEHLSSPPPEASGPGPEEEPPAPPHAEPPPPDASEVAALRGAIAELQSAHEALTARVARLELAHEEAAATTEAPSSTTSPSSPTATAAVTTTTTATSTAPTSTTTGPAALTTSTAPSCSWVEYKQFTDTWANDRVGTSTETMRAVGCAVTSVAMALASRGAKINGATVTPGTLNAWLTQNQGYASGNLIVWDAVRPLGMGTIFVGDRPTMQQLRAWVDACNPVVANVRNGGHWVLVTGYEPTGEVLRVKDPGYQVVTYSLADVSKVRVYAAADGTA